MRTASPSRPRWCGPLLRGSPARGSFAKVGELASWVRTVAGWSPQVRLRAQGRAGDSKAPPDNFCSGIQATVLELPGDMQGALEPDRTLRVCSPPDMKLPTHLALAPRTCGPTVTLETRYSQA